jgi:hypothetical protein
MSRSIGDKILKIKIKKKKNQNKDCNFQSVNDRKNIERNINKMKKLNNFCISNLFLQSINFSWMASKSIIQLTIGRAGLVCWYKL